MRAMIVVLMMMLGGCGDTIAVISADNDMDAIRSIEIEPHFGHILVGQTMAFRARAYMRLGHRDLENRELKWSVVDVPRSEIPSVAAVVNGDAMGLTPGCAAITAMVGSVIGGAMLFVSGSDAGADFR